MLYLAPAMAFIISAIVWGPSNSSLTWLPAISGTPVAASSSAAWAFRSKVDFDQRLASRALALSAGREPLADCTTGVVAAWALVLSASTVGSEAQATRDHIARIRGRQCCARHVFIFSPCCRLCCR